MSGSKVRQHHPAFTRIASHRHVTSYATLVLAGAYQEAGESGRWRVEPGMVVVHAAGEAHADWFGDRRTELIDFDVPRDLTAGVYRCGDADALANDVLAGDGWTGAVALAAVADETDWPDRLAAALRRDTALAIGGWAAEHGLKHATVSRGFAQVYGITAAQYRLGIRIKGAIALLTGGDSALAEVALANGFADQPHMTRAVKAATGATPAQLRNGKSIQEGGRKLQ